MSQLLQADEIAWLRQHEWMWRGASASGMVAVQAAHHGGRGYEPEFMRRYQPGDDIRWVDWATTLRLQRAMVRQPRPMQHSELRIVVDTSSSMSAFATKWKVTMRMVAALGTITISQLNRVQLITPQHVISVSHQALWLDHCEQLYVSPQARLFELPVLEFQAQPLVLCSDLWHADWELLVQRVARASHQPIVVHLLGATELQPPYAGEITLCDSETGREHTVTLDDQIRARYRDALDHHLDVVRATCTRYGVQYHLVDDQRNLMHTIVEVCQ